MTNLDFTQRIKCASCSSLELHTIHDFGIVPLAGYFPSKEEKTVRSDYPLKWQICKKCSLVQTDHLIDPKILFKDYRYISSIGMQSHFNQYAEWLVNNGVNKGVEILEIGCNDGPLLFALREKGIQAEGIDPATNITKLGRDKGLDIIDDFFNTTNVKKYNLTAKYDYILSSNSFAHISDIQSIVKGVDHALKPNGKFIVEVQYLIDLIDKFQFDFIYHEHLYYYTLTSLQNLLNPHGLCIIDFERISIHSGSIRVIIGRLKEHEVNDNIFQQIEQEKKYLNLDDFSAKIEESLKNLSTFFRVNKNKTIVGYGASGRANMIVNQLKLTVDDLKYIVDESPERYNRFIANQEIPIISLEDLIEKPDYILILAWNFADMIIEKTKHLGVPYVIPFPNLIIL